jgi:hypothetical protein
MTFAAVIVVLCGMAAAACAIPAARRAGRPHGGFARDVITGLLDWGPVRRDHE